jgi:hypothetical protein
MHRLKTDNLNPGRISRVVGAMCGDSFFAYRSEAELTKEMPPPR